MVDKKLLEGMSRGRIEDMEPGCLKDILEVQIGGETAGQRLESCLEQLGNPYCFRVDETPVKISFQLSGEPLEKKLRSYFLSLKG